MKTTITLILAAIFAMTMPLCAQTPSLTEPAQAGDAGLSLVGVGAVLRTENGYAEVMQIVPGSPAQKEGHLQVGDRISAVAQGDADFVDVVDMKLDKIVDLIRGKKGTTVRLKIIRLNATGPSEDKVVVIVRDEVKLKEDAESEKSR